MTFNFGKVCGFLLLAFPAFAQYAGPAILSRGEAPTAMSSAPQINFRPFLALMATYDSGLSGVSVNDQGQLANLSSYGAGITGGISGNHAWRHTKLGIDYTGSLYHYARETSYDSVNQSLLLGFSHQFTRHIKFSVRESAGMFSRDFGLLGLQATVPFDPSTSYAPTTDFFDNRTYYGSLQSDVTIQKSARLSFDLGGNLFITRRRSSALAGTTGVGATGDFQYRLTRRLTLGAVYNFGHYDFTRTFGGTDIHGAAGAFAIQLTRTVELTGFAGMMRVESKLEQSVPIDPQIAELLGITSSIEVVHDVSYIPNAAGRLSKTFSRGVAYISAGHTVTPGNGLFLTSFMTSVLGGYTYTGLRRWSFQAQFGYTGGQAIGTLNGGYGNLGGAVSASRKIARSFHLIASYAARKYVSGDYSGYNRLISTATLGIGFSPGEVPIRIW